MKEHVAIVYDWIDSWGGVERVLLVLHKMFPEATFFTSYYNEKKASWAKDMPIKESFLKNLPEFVKKNRVLSLPIYPYAFESFDFSDFNLVISVSSSFAKGVITKPGTTHVAYMLTPPRYLWGQTHHYVNQPVKVLTAPYINNLKKWDQIAAMRPDHLISISQTVADRCRKYYGRSSQVIYPPFDTEYWGRYKKQITMQKDTYYLIVSRLEPYKKVNVAVDAFSNMPEKNLVIIGAGSQAKSLKKKAAKNIQFISSVNDKTLASYYQNAEALIMPQEEDFGYVSLEAQFFGCPVIAYDQGGATETVADNESGIFFSEQTPKSLIEAVRKFDIITEQLKKSLVTLSQSQEERYGKKRFEEEFLRFLQLKSQSKFTQ